MNIEDQNPLETQKGIDDRESAVIREARFFEPYKKELHELFVALGREELWSDDPGELLPYMRSGWIGQEHGNSTEKDQFTDEQSAMALEILEKMGFTGELLPEPGEEFDQTIVVAGTTTANYRRFKLTQEARKQGAELGTEIWLVGQRPREARDGTNEALLGVEGPYAGFDISENPWATHARKVIGETAEEGSDPWKFTETETARLAMLKLIDSNLKPNKIGLNLVSVNGEPYSSYESTEGSPSRDVTDYFFETEDGHEIVLLNATAVERSSGPPRHTTASATQEWLERHSPKQGARVLYVTGNPHSLRTTQDTYKILQEMGRGDIELVVSGTTPAANSPVQTYLGEIARLIDNDWKRNYQGKTEENVR